MIEKQAQQDIDFLFNTFDVIFLSNKINLLDKNIFVISRLISSKEKMIFNNFTKCENFINLNNESENIWHEILYKFDNENLYNLKKHFKIKNNQTNSSWLVEPSYYFLFQQKEKIVAVLGYIPPNDLRHEQWKNDVQIEEGESLQRLAIEQIVSYCFFKNVINMKF
ncbi:hypothetical protein [Hugenholtzia roseola]|uniref:hypothetical protein n=1 Tax=Hugenholtzia roseola TaxID=1002 RepID=UPI0012B561B4|nr:hypothetical protein [Hugenholtzia roseola]